VPVTYRAVLTLIVLALAVPARAQETVGAWTNLRVDRLPTVYVLDESGRERSGTLLALDETSLVLLVDGRAERIEAAQVRRVARRGDSLKNGALIGMAVGVAMGLIAGGLAECVDDQGEIRGCRAATRLGLAGLSIAMYGAMGTGLDALRTGRTLLYEAPRPAAARSAPARPVRLVWRLTW